MIDSIYVILIDGRPYYKDSGIRTYKTRENAFRRAQEIARRADGRRIEIAKFSVTEKETVQHER